jgi:hypothetical protein
MCVEHIFSLKTRDAKKLKRAIYILIHFIHHQIEIIYDKFFHLFVHLKKKLRTSSFILILVIIIIKITLLISNFICIPKYIYRYNIWI